MCGQYRISPRYVINKKPEPFPPSCGWSRRCRFRSLFFCPSPPLPSNNRVFIFPFCATSIPLPIQAWLRRSHPPPLPSRPPFPLPSLPHSPPLLLHPYPPPAPQIANHYPVQHHRPPILKHEIVVEEQTKAIHHMRLSVDSPRCPRQRKYRCRHRRRHPSPPRLS